MVSSYYDTSFEPSSNLIYFRAEYCRGTESNLLECSNDFIIDGECFQGLQLGIKCEGNYLQL